MRIVLLCLFIASQNALAGWYVGNGGDAIECFPGTDNNLNGIYSLDYILTLQDPKGDDGMASVKSWQASSDRLLKILTEKVPTLSASFRDFSRLLYNKDFSKPRVWEPAPFGLVKLDDQRIASVLPSNCRAANGEFQIMQAVIRLFEDFAGTNRGHYVYKYFPEVLKRLEEQSPLQLSFLLVHEWLWDVSHNVDRNRRVNRFLHSREIETMSADQVVGTLKGMGVILPEKFDDAFDADLWQGYNVTKEQFFEKFDSDSPKFLFGQMEVNRRVKPANCPEGDFYCDPNWRAMHENFLLDPSRSRFFLMASWANSIDGEYPIKVVSPELLMRSGRRFRPGSGEIECRFIENAGPDDNNMECRFRDPQLINALFNTYDNDRKRQDEWPTMKARFTEECFRMLIPSTRTIDHLRPGANEERTEMIETVFTVRYKWNR